MGERARVATMDGHGGQKSKFIVGEGERRRERFCVEIRGLLRFGRVVQ